MMSRANLEVVRRIREAWERRDQSSMRAPMDPDIVVVQLPDQPDVRPYHGPDGVLRAIAEWVDTWENYAIEPHDMRDIGDSVLVSAHQRERGQASGVQMEADVFSVFGVQRGKIVRWRMFSSERQPLEAAGLVE